MTEQKTNKSLADKIIEIQAELKAPKNQFNKFANFKYRSCEDILEAVKPLLKKHSLTIKLKDEPVLIGDRYYIKATVIVGTESDITETTAYAREPLTKKGMDESQATGSTSSYARKYALNGMFAIDDTKDADTMDNSDNKAQKKPKDKSSEIMILLRKINPEITSATAVEKIKELTELDPKDEKSKQEIISRLQVLLDEKNDN